MAPGYSPYSNYYDPVGSQANQPQGYAYHNPTSSASQSGTAAYHPPTYAGYPTGSYASQKYTSNAGAQHTGTVDSGTASNAATGANVAGLSGQDGQTRASRSSSTQQYESGSGSWGNPNFASASYTGTLQMPERSQSNTSPLYASNAPSGNFGRMRYDAPSQQPQSNTPAYSQESYIQQSAPQSYATNATADASRQTYGATQQKKTTTEPSRYASPLHAVQAQQQQNQSRQQGHARQSSGASNHQPSPMNNPRAPASYTQHRQSSASVEPTANTTVDPSQVYDFRAEREKKAKAEAEKRRKMEEVEAAKKAEEARLAEQQRQADEAKRQAEERIEKIAKQAKRKAEQQAKRKADEEAKAAAAAAAAEENRKSRENPNAASTLASLASSSNVPGPSDALAPDDEEAQMRAMFQKMREFNSKNPAMLAKLWEEERRSHAAQSQSPQPAKPALSSKNDKSGPITATPSERAQPIAGLSTSSATLTAPAVQNQVSVNPLQPANAHLWPPGKKVLLAEVAAKWLTSTNPPRVVTTSQVLERLDRNPNYVQLCESLEATGLRIDRAAFAREILKSVQQPGPAAQTSPKTSDSTLMSANGTIAQAASTATETASPQAGEPKAKKRRATKAEMEQRRALGLAKGKRPVNSSNMVDYEMPVYSTVADTPGAAQAPLASTQEYSGLTHTHPLGMSSHQHTSNNNSRQPSQSMVPEQQPIANAHQDSPIPVGSAQPTLEVKPHSPPRPPADKEEAARKRGFGDLVDLTAEDSDEDAPPKRIMLGPQDQSSQRQPMQQQQPGSFGKFSVRQYASPKPNFPSQPFVPPGAPTTAQPLMQNRNFSMAPTADMGFKFSNTPINPSAPPTLPTNAPPPPKRKGPTNEQLQADRIRGKMVVEPIMRDRVARRSAYDSRTIARDVLLATGRHPDMRPLNSHLNVMQKMLGDKGGMADTSGNKSDLATIRWDIIDPDPPRKSEKSKDAKDEELPTGVTRSTEVDGQDADDEKDMSSTQKRGVVTDVGPDRQSFPIPNNNKPTPKKRGRPPRASNGDNFNMTTPAANPGATRHTPSQMRGTPSSSNAAEGAIGYAAFRQLDENGNPIKKKGRPVGWRKSVHSREAQGLTPAKPGTSSATKPESKPTVAKQEARLQEPTYQVYKCSWLGCSAELHSLEILKKHIIKVHGQAGAEDLHSCLWQGCQTKSSGKQSATFDNIDDWLAHVDKEHLQPVAWQLGDGPRGGLSDQLDSETSEAYLSDSRGRSVTPIIRPMADFGLGEGPGQGSYSGLGRPPAGSSKDERVARAELQKLKDRKKAVEPSLEKTGVRLANDKRRMGFLDDENFEDVVESEGEGPAN